MPPTTSLTATVPTEGTRHEEILGTLLVHGMDMLGAQRGAILRLEAASLQALLGRQDGQLTWGAASFVDEALVRSALAGDQPYVQAQARPGSGEPCAVLCLPLRAEPDRLILYADRPAAAGDAFGPGQVRMLQALAQFARLAMSNARQVGQVQRKRLIEAELAIAHTIQQSFFPTRTPRVGGLRVAGSCDAAQEVGGDYYDIIPLANGQVALTLGDVSGKGIAASLYMAVVRTALRMALRYGHDPREVLVEVNARIHEDLQDGSFITCFLGVYDAATRAFTYASAGQNLGVWLADGQLKDLAGRGLPLGLPPAAFAEALEARRIRLAPEDRLALVTDGVIEALGPTDEEFGEERLHRALLATAGMPPEAALAEIRATIRAHVDVALPWDDMTLMLAEVDAPDPRAKEDPSP